MKIWIAWVVAELNGHQQDPVTSLGMQSAPLGEETRMAARTELMMCSRLPNEIIDALLSHSISLPQRVHHQSGGMATSWEGVFVVALWRQPALAGIFRNPFCVGGPTQVGPDSAKREWLEYRFSSAGVGSTSVSPRIARSALLARPVRLTLAIQRLQDRRVPPRGACDTADHLTRGKTAYPFDEEVDVDSGEDEDPGAHGAVAARRA